ncbi:MAG: hypothetical protein KIT56_04665 [Gammaproteobacteria bacterium]|nr:hypothetical protein [Gammaproteobacteria bacterium]MCW5583170.1 hypothetical protein [Gammaproteobacteria bacterium]
MIERKPEETLENLYKNLKKNQEYFCEELKSETIDAEQKENMQSLLKEAQEKLKEQALRKTEMPPLPEPPKIK